MEFIMEYNGKKVEFLQNNYTISHFAFQLCEQLTFVSYQCLLTTVFLWVSAFCLVKLLQWSVISMTFCLKYPLPFESILFISHRKIQERCIATGIRFLQGTNGTLVETLNSQGHASVARYLFALSMMEESPELPDSIQVYYPLVYISSTYSLYSPPRPVEIYE